MLKPPARPIWSRDPRRLTLFVVAVFNIAVAATVPTEVDRGLLHELLPDLVRVALWCSAAIICLLGATLHRWQTIGYAVAVAMPVERAISHLWSFTSWLIPGPPPGDLVGLAWTVIWASLVALIIILSGIPAVTTEVEKDGT